MPRSIRSLSFRPCSFAIVGLGRVGVEADAIAELAAEHLPARNAPGLAGEIHQRHLDAAHAAGLARVVAELLDLPEDLVDVARVLAEDAALEHQRVGLAGAVAHFAAADEPLVRVDADERARHRRPDHDRDAEVGDLQRRRLATPPHVLRERDEIGGASPRRLAKAAPATPAVAERERT